MGAELNLDSYFEQHAVDGTLPDEAMANLLTGDPGDTAAPSADSGTTPDPAPESTEKANNDAAGAKAGDGKPGDTADAEGDSQPVVLAKDGKNVIPYEKLVEAREEAKAAREENQALMQEMESIKAMVSGLNNQQAGQPPAQTAEPQAPEQSAIDAELADLKEQLADLPEVVAFVERATKGPLHQIELLKQQVEALTGQIAPMQANAQKSEAEAHYQAIKSAHYDADAIVDAPEFGTWLQKQPSFVQDSYSAVLERGTAKQVVELFTAFKDATGWGKESNATAGDTAAPAGNQPAKVRTTTPTTLSDIPAGAAPHHDEAEALMQMPAHLLVQKFLSMDPAKVAELLPKLV